MAPTLRTAKSKGTKGEETVRKKRPPKLNQWDTVIVVWEDAYDRPGPHHSKSIVEKYEPCIRETTGKLIVEDERRVSLATDDDRRNSEIITDGDCGNVCHIPRGMVRDIIKLTTAT